MEERTLQDLLDDIIQQEQEEETEQKPRSAYELLSKSIPYSEMTDQEIENVIDYVSDFKAQQKEAQQRIEENRIVLEELANTQKEQSEQMLTDFKAACKACEDRYLETLS